MTEVIKKIVLALWAVVLLAGCGKDKYPQGGTMAEWTETYIQQSVEKGNLKGGISAMVYRKGEILYSGGSGFADRETGSLIGSETPMPVGSISKIFTSVAVMTLVEEGKIDLDKPAGSYLPKLKLNNSAEMSFTVRDLLTHHSGIQGDLFDQWFDTDDEYVYQLLKDRPLAAVAGRLFSYANIGFTLLGLIVEEQSGIPFEQYVGKSIFEPAGMTESFARPGLADRELPRGYRGKTSIPVPAIRDYAAGGFIVSSDDMGRFIWALYNSERILEKETLRQMLSVQNAGNSVDRDFSIGLGFWLIDPLETGELNASHGGDLPPYHSILITYPERELAVFVATNDHSKGGIVAMEAGLEIAAQLLDREGIAHGTDSPAASVPMDEKEMDQVVGLYNTMAGVVEIERKGKNYYLKLGKMKLRLNKTDRGYYKGEMRLFNLIPIPIAQIEALDFDLYEAEGDRWLGLWMKGVYMGTGSRLEEVSYGGEFETYRGKYMTPEGTNLLEDGSYAISDIEIYENKGRYVMKMNLLGQKVTMALRPAGEGMAVTDGTGRAMGDLLRFEIDEVGNTVLYWSGFQLEKIIE